MEFLSNGVATRTGIVQDEQAGFTSRFYSQSLNGDRAAELFRVGLQYHVVGPAAETVAVYLRTVSKTVAPFVTPL